MKLLIVFSSLLMFFCVAGQEALQNEAMDNLRVRYGVFYDKLTESVPLLVARYTHLTQRRYPNFKYAVEIPKILSKNAQEFSSLANLNNTHTKCCLVFDMTNLLFFKIQGFVGEEYKEWVRDTGVQLQFTSTLVETAFWRLKMNVAIDLAPRLEITPSAFSGENQAIQLQSLDADILLRLSDLVRALQSV